MQIENQKLEEEEHNFIVFHLIENNQSIFIT
jgi:hypothetical protein